MLRHLGIAAALAAFAVPAGAATQIVSPDNDYRDHTNLLGVTAPDGPNQSEVTDGMLTVAFSSLLNPGAVGVDWSTWGSPPDTEDATPMIWYSDGASSVTFTFDKALAIWGFEVEGNSFVDTDFTLDFYQNGVPIYSVNRTINGNAGARLMAAAAGAGEYFTSVTLSANEDFAIAQLRYQLAIVPEPATWALLIAGFGMVGIATRRRGRLRTLHA